MTTSIASNYRPATFGIPTIDGGLMIHTRTDGSEVRVGDLFRPVSDQYPLEVKAVRHTRGWWNITDNSGIVWRYRDTYTIPTAMLVW